MPNLIVPQQGITHTASATTSGLLDIIRTASADNVQPQAVLAAESLGAKLLFSSQLYSPAIEALSDREPRTIRRLKLAVGLNSGGTINIIRESPPLIGVFLFVCALKPCLTDSDLGDLIFQMMVESRMLNNFTLSSFQLCGLIQCFSSHAEALIPIDLLEELAVKIDEYQRRYSALYSIMDATSLAKLLVRIFRLLRDDSVDTITVSGEQSGIWLATLFYFMMPEKTLISMDGKIIKGTEGHYKLKIELLDTLGVAEDCWKIKEWKKGHLATFIVPLEKFNSNECTYMPLNLIHNYLSHQRLPHINIKDSKRVLSVIGEIVGALIGIVSKFGSIHDQSERCCEGKENKCKRVSLIEIFPDEWRRDYSSIVTNYGWAESPDMVRNQMKLISILQAEFRQCRATSRDGKTMWDRLRSRIKDFLVERLGRSFHDYGYRADYYEILILDAVYIAIDAIMTAICVFESRTRRIAPISTKGRQFSEECIISFLSYNGMEFSDYRKRCLAQVLPGNGPFHERDVVISSNGLVASLNSLWELDTRQCNALTFRIIEGTIKRDGILYSAVREEIWDLERGVRGDVEYAEMFQDNEYVGVSPRCEEKNVTVETLVAVTGARLHARSHLSLNGEILERLSWTDSAKELAFARHITDEFGYSLGQEEELAKIHKATLSQVYWHPCYSWGPDEIHGKTLIKTFRNRELRFFSPGILYRQRNMVASENCFTLVVQHSPHLLRGMIAGEERGGAWAIIC